MANFDVFKLRNAKRSPKKVVVSVGPKTQTDDIRSTAREIIQDARDEAFRIKKSAEEEARKIRQESLEIEKRIAQKAELLDLRLTQVEKSDKETTATKEAFLRQEQEISKIRSELINKLERVTSLTAEEAKKIILENLEEELKNEIAKKIKRKLKYRKMRKLAKY